MRQSLVVVAVGCFDSSVVLNLVDALHAVCSRGGQTFPKSTEIRNSVAFCTFFSIFFPSVFVRGGRFGFRAASPTY